MYMTPGSSISSNSQRKKTRSWTEYEDQRLLAAIHKYGTDNWVSVAAFVGNGRTRAQCSQRWTRGLDPRISKDKWTNEDEELLMRLVIQYGTKSWTRIAQEIGNRSDVQCRYHYKQMKQEMDLESDSSSGIANSNNIRHLNLPPSSISASNSGTLPTIPKLFDPFPHVQNKSYFNDKGLNFNTINFKNSPDNNKNTQIDPAPMKISSSGSLPAHLTLSLQRGSESSLSPHFGGKLNTTSNNPKFYFHHQNQDQNYSTSIQSQSSRASNKVDLPSINDLLNDVSTLQPQIKKSMLPVTLFENSSYLDGSSCQNNSASNHSNSSNINRIGNDNNNLS